MISLFAVRNDGMYTCHHISMCYDVGGHIV